MSIYRPDPRIVKYLKEYDRDLDAEWDIETGRWWVTWRGRQAQCCQNNDGSYRPLDERAVTKVALSDAWSHRSGREYLRVRNEHNHRLTEAEKRRSSDDFRQYIVEEGHRKVYGVGQKTGRGMYAGWSATA